ncbi:MAG TPA: hypothetical protein VH542_03860 [Steroidobacteraceae bacterium]
MSSRRARTIFVVAVVCAGVGAARAAEEHAHPIPEKLGNVTFKTSCSPEVQAPFNRAVALLHSFTYQAAEQAFRDVSRRDPKCAMAHWGVALSYYHPLWEAPDAAHLRAGLNEVDAARALDATAREQAYIEAAGAYYRESNQLSYAERARAYEQAMAGVAARYPDDVEARIFHALSLLATASPTDRTHAKQKQAIQILEPLYLKYPDHPGLAHYLIHACDSSELAARGLAAARAYSQIAPSAPHALHMPSHIFTRLGLWDDSVASNLAARDAARAQGDVGEELHSMDYLTYAYLQLGRVSEAQQIVSDAAARTSLSGAEFKIGYAANAMPVRLAIEQGRWATAAKLEPLAGSPPQVAAIVYWARAVGQARGNPPQNDAADIARIAECRQELETAGSQYWATQTGVLEQEARAWTAVAGGDAQKGIDLMRAAADKEDAVEKLPLTPGPIVPAREQLGEILLAAGRPADALSEFQSALKGAPGRRGALQGVARAQEQLARQ